MAKDFLEKFESISEFQRAINTRKVDRFYQNRMASVNNGKEFTGTESYEEAEKLLSHGDKSIAAKLVECNGKRMNETKKSTIYNSPIGFVPNIPNYLSGRPDNMFAVKTQTYKSCKVLNVCVNAITKCVVESEDILAFNKKLLNVVYTLKKRGYRLNMYVGACFIKVKDSGKLLNVTNVAYPLCNVSFARRHMFKWMETAKDIHGKFHGKLFRSVEQTKDVIKRLFPNISNVATIATDLMLNYSESEIMNVILNDK